ncbi:hypothetical protein C5167_022966 [Papaver somniferum]|uniref:Uncharacterized protein n=1 Tax=Papaver somniferum TaxID=3469 RepID=A0A4Y7JJF8_PAPSO|nr:hypothetical protein C5167_022966 [Papaver somniferum]
MAMEFSPQKEHISKQKNLGPGVDGWAVSLKGMMTIVVCTGLSICGIYRWVNIFEPLPVTARRRCVREGSSTYRLEVQDLLETSRCLNKLDYGGTSRYLLLKIDAAKTSASEIYFQHVKRDNLDCKHFWNLICKVATSMVSENEEGPHIKLMWPDHIVAGAYKNCLPLGVTKQQPSPSSQEKQPLSPSANQERSQLEREHYEYITVEGKIVHKKSNQVLDTTKGSNKSKWVFVIRNSTLARLFGTTSEEHQPEVSTLSDNMSI